MRLAVSSDLHLLSKTLYDNGEAFQKMYYGSDGKQIKYGEVLIDKMFAEIGRQDIDLLLLTGDLTLNGEYESHLQIIAKLNRLKRDGLSILVLPGNHDIRHQKARRYEGTQSYPVDTIGEQDFCRLYDAFGYGGAAAKDPNSLSYRWNYDEKLWILCMDNCCRKHEIPQRYGEVSEETLEWIEEQLKLARAKGAYVIAAGHYNLAYHNKLFRSGFTMKNQKQVAGLLSKYGVEVFLSGHMHMQHMEEADGILDIATSSPCTYPHQYGMFEIWEQGKYQYQTRQITLSRKDKADYRRFYYNNFVRQVSEELEEIDGIPSVEKIEMAVYAARLNLYYFSGSLYQISDKVPTSHSWRLWQKYGNHLFFYSYMQSMLQDSMRDHNHYRKG